MADLFLALGSNLGDRKANLLQALLLLDGYFGPRKAVSEMIETEAIGFDGKDFINCVAKYSSRRKPINILKICKEIERKMGRKDDVEWDENGNRVYHNRIIDIDILSYGDVKMNTAELTIPHPQIETRPFVKPLLDQIK